MSIVSSIPWLESVDAKLDRAHEHLNVIDRQLDDFVKTTKDKSHFSIKTNPQTAQVWMVWWIDEPHHPPLALSVRIGEFLYNLRSSLDNLICALVRSKKPASSCAGRGFPIYTDASRYAGIRASVLRGVPDAPKKIIDGLQPYTRGHGSVDLDPLNTLNSLCNRDKHRALNLATGYNRNSQFLVSTTEGRPLVSFSIDRAMFAAGPQTIPLPVDPAAVQPKANIKAMGASVVAFPDVGPWGERPVDEILVTCLQYVEDRVISPLTPFFE